MSTPDETLTVPASRVGVLWGRAGKWLQRISFAVLASPLVLIPWKGQLARWLGAIGWQNASAFSAEFAIFGSLATMALSLLVLALSASGSTGQEVRASPGRLELVRLGGGVDVVPAARVVAANVRPAGARRRVELELAGGDRAFAEVATDDDADRLLTAAGLDASRRRFRVELDRAARVVARQAAAVAGTVIGSLALIGAIMVPRVKISGPVGLLLLVVIAALAALAARAQRATAVSVGTDGVLVEKPFSKTFVPLDDVASVERHGAKLRVGAKDGGVDVKARAGSEDALDALEQRIARARAPGEPDASGVDLLARAGRTVDAWRAALRALVTKGDYRQRGVTPEELAALVESPNVTAEQRVGAALALADAGDDHRARVRVAASAVASPRLRVALEHLADGTVDDEAIEEALASCEAASPDESSRADDPPGLRS